MIKFHLAALFASFAVAAALPVRLELAASLFCAVGIVAIFLHDYARQPRALRLPQSQPQPRTLRARAHFRPLPLSLPVQPRGLEIRPIIHRLREPNRLAA